MDRKLRTFLTRRAPKLLLAILFLSFLGTLIVTGQELSASILFAVGFGGSFNKSFSLGNLSFANSQVAGATYDSEVKSQITLPVAWPVSSWVKTDADTAAGNLAGGHGQTSGTYDCFWTAAGVNYCRYGVTNTITTNACALDGGAGDDFPASATATVTIVKQTVATCNIDGDNVNLFGVFLRSTDTAAMGSADFQDASNNSIEQFDLTEVDTTAAGMDKAFQQVAARALLTGAVITQVKCSQSSTTVTGTLFILAGQDSTP